MSFGHHPDITIDFSTEVDVIAAEIIDRAAGLPPTMDLGARIAAAMEFSIVGSPAAVVAKSELRGIDSAYRAGQAHNATNAARYECVREQTWDASAFCVVMNPKDAVKLGRDCPSHERLDALVDEARHAKPATPAPSEEAMVDAAMVEMRNIVPPLRRSDCARLIRAAMGAAAK